MNVCVGQSRLCKPTRSSAPSNSQALKRTNCLLTKPGHKKSQHSCLRSDNKIDISLLPRAGFDKETAEKAENGSARRDEREREREKE